LQRGVFRCNGGFSVATEVSVVRGVFKLGGERNSVQDSLFSSKREREKGGGVESELRRVEEVFERSFGGAWCADPASRRIREPIRPFSHPFEPTSPISPDLPDPSLRSKIRARERVWESSFLVGVSFLSLFSFLFFGSNNPRPVSHFLTRFGFLIGSLCFLCCWIFFSGLIGSDWGVFWFGFSCRCSTVSGALAVAGLRFRGEYISYCGPTPFPSNLVDLISLGMLSPICEL